MQPRHGLARAEIARAHFLLGERELARQNSETVQQSPGAPAEALVTIEKYLELLESSRAPTALGTTISGYIDVTLGYDSNVNSATDKDAVLISVLAPFFGGAFTTPR